jgi:hypothetical protein
MGLRIVRRGADDRSRGPGRAIDKNTKFVAITLLSNVCGRIEDAKASEIMCERRLRLRRHHPGGGAFRRRRCLASACRLLNHKWLTGVEARASSTCARSSRGGW